MNKKKTTLVVALVLMGVAVLGLAAAVYAKYISTATSGSDTREVAVWAFKADNEGKGDVECDLAKTYNASTLVAEKIAPGTSGICTITVSNEHSDVGITYTLTKADDWAGPQNIVFSKDGSSFTSITGTLAPGETKPITIDWNWPYYVSSDEDTEDTEDGTNAANNTMTVKFSIEGIQVQPN